MPEPMTRVLKIVNEKGLHARASAKLVELVEGFDAEAEVSKDGMSVTGDSIMGLLMLAASRAVHSRDLHRIRVVRHDPTNREGRQNFFY